MSRNAAGTRHRLTPPAVTEPGAEKPALIPAYACEGDGKWKTPSIDLAVELSAPCATTCSFGSSPISATYADMVVPLCPRTSPVLTALPRSASAHAQVRRTVRGSDQPYRHGRELLWENCSTYLKLKFGAFMEKMCPTRQTDCREERPPRSVADRSRRTRQAGPNRPSHPLKHLASARRRWGHTVGRRGPGRSLPDVAAPRRRLRGRSSQRSRQDAT
jgi:hypothetical protein